MTTADDTARPNAEDVRALALWLEYDAEAHDMSPGHRAHNVAEKEREAAAMLTRLLADRDRAEAERDEARAKIREMLDAAMSMGEQWVVLSRERDEARAALAAAETELLHCRDTASKVEDMERALVAAEQDARIGHLVREKMRSGNSIPVERCTITAAELAAMQQEGRNGTPDNP